MRKIRVEVKLSFMANAPLPPWTYRCEKEGCEFFIFVNARGARGNDPGSGVEAALLMRKHLVQVHGEEEEADDADNRVHWCNRG